MAGVPGKGNGRAAMSANRTDCSGPAGRKALPGDPAGSYDRCMPRRTSTPLATAAAGLLAVALVLGQLVPAAAPTHRVGASDASTAAVGTAAVGAVSGGSDSTASAPGGDQFGAASSGRGAGMGVGPDSNPIATPDQTSSTARTAAPQAATGPAAVGPAVAPAAGSAGHNDPVPGLRSPSVAGSPSTPRPCPTFPASNVWNKDISALPIAANSSTMINAIGRTDYLHPDFDAIGDGIPYNVVDSTTPTYTVHFDYADESDPGPYPIPAGPRIEKGSDRHMLLLNKGACRLYELYDVRKSGSTWYAGSGAIWDLRSNALRPDGWTSADAAGLPILPGLVLYSEVQSGVIKHAIRFTAPDTCGYIYPARHLTADPCSNLPPMGLRVRLKASVDISGFGPQARVVLTALKRYGMILADNGSPWYITGEPDARWNDGELHLLQDLTGSDFEVVDTSGLRNG
jgi:hypothetical protein